MNGMLKIMIHKYSYGKGYSTVDIEVYEKELTIQSLANEDHRLCVSLNEWNEFLATLYTIRADLFR